MFEERVSQDTSQMKFMNDLQADGYVKPEFIRGPVFKFFREENRLNNKSKYIHDGAYDSISEHALNNFNQGRKNNYHSKGESSRVYYQKVQPH
jgi:hypothetical protein